MGTLKSFQGKPGICRAPEMTQPAPGKECHSLPRDPLSPAARGTQGDQQGPEWQINKHRILPCLAPRSSGPCSSALYSQSGRGLGAGRHHQLRKAVELLHPSQDHTAPASPFPCQE